MSRDNRQGQANRDSLTGSPDPSGGSGAGGQSDDIGVIVAGPAARAVAKPAPKSAPSEPLNSKARTMPRAQFQNPKPPKRNRPEQFEPGARPIEPDEGPVPPVIPDDPERERSTDPVMAQAKRDIDAGLVDTDMRATAGLNAKRRAQLVPGPGGKPPSTDT